MTETIKCTTLFPFKTKYTQFKKKNILRFGHKKGTLKIQLSFINLFFQEVFYKQSNLKVAQLGAFWLTMENLIKNAQFGCFSGRVGSSKNWATLGSFAAIFCNFCRDIAHFFLATLMRNIMVIGDKQKIVFISPRTFLNS